MILIAVSVYRTLRRLSLPIKFAGHEPYLHAWKQSRIDRIQPF